MAHVSNTIDLATQPATTGTSGLWRSPANAFVVVALGVAIALGAAFMARSNVASVAPAADQSYTQVESLRGATGLAGASVDHRNDDIELLRAARRSIAAGSFDKFQVPHGAVALP